MNEKKTLLGLKHFILFFKCLNASNFRAFSFFGSHIFCAEKKIYKRYGHPMASKNCPNYSSFVRNNKSCNIMHSLDYISLRVYPPPKFTKSRNETQICI